MRKRQKHVEPPPKPDSMMSREQEIECLRAWQAEIDLLSTSLLRAFGEVRSDGGRATVLRDIGEVTAERDDWTDVASEMWDQHVLAHALKIGPIQVPRD